MFYVILEFLQTVLFESFSAIYHRKAAIFTDSQLVLMIAAASCWWRWWRRASGDRRDVDDGDFPKWRHLCYCASCCVRVVVVVYRTPTPTLIISKFRYAWFISVVGFWGGRSSNTRAFHRPPPTRLRLRHHRDGPGPASSSVCVESVVSLCGAVHIFCLRVATVAAESGSRVFTIDWRHRVVRLAPPCWFVCVGRLPPYY